MISHCLVRQGSMMDKSIPGHVIEQQDLAVRERMSDEHIPDFICQRIVMMDG